WDSRSEAEERRSDGATWWEPLDNGTGPDDKAATEKGRASSRVCRDSPQSEHRMGGPTHGVGTDRRSSAAFRPGRMSRQAARSMSPRCRSSPITRNWSLTAEHSWKVP